MLPRLISQEQFEELQGCMPRFIPEWGAESLTATVKRMDIHYKNSFHLCHWQCEPFYFFLRDCSRSSEEQAEEGEMDHL